MFAADSLQPARFWLCRNFISIYTIFSYSDEPTKARATEENETIDTVENGCNARQNENDTEDHETNDSSKMHETQSKSQTMEPPKLKRSESAFSNISKNAHSSTLSSKVFALEENLKRLQSIVGSLISHVDGNNNVIPQGQLDQLLYETGDTKTFANIHDNPAQYGERSTTMGVGYEQFDGSALDSGRIGESMSVVQAESALRRPVTQPVLTSANRKPEIRRSKTADYSERRNKPLIRQGSMPIKFKPRQFVPTIAEETQQGEHGIEGVTKDTQGEFKKEGVNEDVQEGEIWIGDDVPPNEGLSMFFVVFLHFLSVWYLPTQYSFF